MNIEMDDNAFWLSLWTSLSICFVIFTSVMLFYCHNKNKFIAETIGKSNSPIEIAIAFGKDFQSSDVAMLLSEKTQTKKEK